MEHLNLSINEQVKLMSARVSHARLPSDLRPSLSLESRIKREKVRSEEVIFGDFEASLGKKAKLVQAQSATAEQEGLSKLLSRISQAQKDQEEVHDQLSESASFMHNVPASTQSRFQAILQDQDLRPLETDSLFQNTRLSQQSFSHLPEASVSLALGPSKLFEHGPGHIRNSLNSMRDLLSRRHDQKNDNNSNATFHRHEKHQRFID